MDIDKDTIKAFCDIDKAIDDSFLKLSDKLHDLTLSHNRKKQALERIRTMLEYIDPLPGSIFDGMLKLCNDALYSDGRVYYKPHKITMRDVKRKKKGGRQCAQN